MYNPPWPTTFATHLRGGGPRRPWSTRPAANRPIRTNRSCTWSPPEAQKPCPLQRRASAEVCGRCGGVVSARPTPSAGAPLVGHTRSLTSHRHEVPARDRLCIPLRPHSHLYLRCHLWFQKRPNHQGRLRQAPTLQMHMLALLHPIRLKTTIGRLCKQFNFLCN